MSPLGTRQSAVRGLIAAFTTPFAHSSPSIAPLPRVLNPTAVRRSHSASTRSATAGHVPMRLVNCAVCRVSPGPSSVAPV